MNTGNTYRVTLQYPRATRQPAYCEDVEAVTKAEAILIVAGRAKNEGMKGAPIKQQAVILRGEV